MLGFFNGLRDTDLVPPGYFSGGLLQWGKMLTEETYISKGIDLTGLADQATLDDSSLADLYERNLSLLQSLGPNDAIKIHYTVENDFENTLAAFDGRTDAAKRAGNLTPWGELQRRYATQQFRTMGERGSLQREKVYLYLCRKVNPVKETGGSLRAGPVTNWLRQQETNLRLGLEQIAAIYGCSRDGIMGDAEHCLHLRKWANPSLATVLARGVAAVRDDLDVARSIESNVVRSEASPFTLPDDRVVLRWDGQYYAFLVVDRRPRSTDLRRLVNVLRAVKNGITITMTFTPLDTTAEVEEGEAQILKLENRKNPKLGNEITINEQQGAIRNKVRALAAGEVMPFNAFWAFAVHAPDMATLNERMTALKSALNSFEGLGYFEVNHPETARRVFAETCPGWAGSAYRGHDIYWESTNLADLLPMSASFTGWLDEADALMPGASGTVVGVRLFDRATNTPLFIANMGKTGSGKTSDSIAVISQAAHTFGFAAIFDEGLAWHTLALLLGYAPAILREGNTPTVNPFDPNGLPRTGAMFDEIAGIGMKLVGVSSDDDINQSRAALLRQYAQALSDARASDWLDEDQERAQTLARELAAVLAFKKTLSAESDLVDAFVAWQNFARAHPAEVEPRLAAVPEATVVDLLTDPAQRVTLLDYAYTRMLPEEAATWGQLVFTMQRMRLPLHTGTGVSLKIIEELDTIGGRIAAGRAGGPLGNFLDGVTNLVVAAPGIYVETSFLPKDSLLRSVAPITILGRVRRFVVTQPRGMRKLVIFEEFRKLAEIPQFEKAAQENLAQFRKYLTLFIANFQSPGQIDELNPAMTDLLFGQCSQFWLHALPSAKDIERIARARGLPMAAQRAIMGYKLLSDQRGAVKATYMNLFVPGSDGSALTGTIQQTGNPPLLYVVASNGDAFDERQKVLRKYPDAFTGVITEVQAKLDAERRAAPAPP